MERTWMDIRQEQPKHLQNVFFLLTINPDEPLIGFYLKVDDNYDIIGRCVIGTVYDEKTFHLNHKIGCATGLSYSVWKENEYEVTHWLPIECPEPPKK